MIDPNIITRGAELAQLQQQQNMEALGNLGGNFGKMVLGRRINQMRQLDGDNERKAFANDSIFAPYLNETLKADQAAAQKAMYDQMKAEADIAKTSSEAYKNNQQGAGFGLDNSGKKLGAIESIIQQAAITGDPGQVLIGLNRLAKTGLISPEQYQQEAAIVQAMTPEELQKYAQGNALTNKEVAPYLYETKNNFANNAQSDINNQRTTQASMYGVDVAAETADKNRVQQQSQFDANLYVQQNKPLDYFTAADGTRYAVYANGKGIPISSAQGTPLKAQPQGGAGMNSTTQKAILETDEVVSAGTNAIKNLKDALTYSKDAYDGLGASQRAYARGMIGDGSKEATATTMLNNIVTGNALEMLKATFGGAPTEGERAILLQLQGSANLPRAQREAIYTRAMQMAEDRLKLNQQKAQGLRDGSYFSPQGSTPSQPPNTFSLFD